jgi:hypothetical protein
MSTNHESLLPQADQRLRGSELILKGYDNETIADSVEVTPSAVFGVSRLRLRIGLFFISAKCYTFVSGGEYDGLRVTCLEYRASEKVS